MKEAIAWHYQGLMVLGLMAVGWLVALVVAASTTSKLKSLHRFVVVGIVALSFPAYIAYGFWYAEYSPNSLKGNQRLRLAGVEEQTALYKKLCSAGQPIVVNKTIESPGPVNIRIEEQPNQRLGYTLELTQPWHPAKSVCWMAQSSDPCPSSNISRIEFKRWVYSNLKTRCEASPAFRDAAKCVERSFQFDRQSQATSLAEANTLDSSYVLAVSSAESLGPQVIKFSVAIKTGGSDEVLGHTYLLKRIAFGDMPYPLAHEPPHCPPRDAHIADLLSKVFPTKQRAASR